MNTPAQAITTRKSTKAPKVFLKPGTIYSADNGMLICAHCAGSSALHTGRDISGQKVEEMTEEDGREWQRMTGRPMACERGCTVYGIATEVTKPALA